MRADEALSIDEECRCAGYALVFPGFSFRAHFGEILVAVEARAEPGLVESQLGGETFQIRFGVRAAIFAALSGKQQVVVLPELALLIRAFGCACRPFGFRAEDGDVLIDEFDFTRIDKILFDATRRVISKSFAVRSLKIGQFDEGYRGLGVAPGFAGVV